MVAAPNPPVRSAGSLQAADVPPQLIVKFSEAETLSHAASIALIEGATQKAFSVTGPPAPVMRALFLIPEKRTEQLVNEARAAAALEGRTVPDLLKFYARRLPDISVLPPADAKDAVAAIHAAVHELRQDGRVESAYIESPPAPPPTRVHFLDDPQVTSQTYLRAAPEGVGAIPLWMLDLPKCAGDEVRFVDVETGWYTDHEDLSLASATPIVGVNKNDKEHGTSVLGIVNAVDNTKGIVGLAPHAIGRIASPYIEYSWGGATLSLYSRALAMWCAAVSLMDDVRGHVMIVEMQCTVVEADGPDGTTGVLLPVEAELLNWAVITVARYCGVVVVEAAGNGDRKMHVGGIANLPSGTFDFLNAARDSGAIMVAAGKYVPAAGITPATYVRYAESNYGSRIDCFARADGLCTLSTSPSAYRDDFTQTSAATAVIAGVVLVAQSMARQILHRMLTPSEVRQVVRSSLGTPSRIGSGIRRMPDLMRIGQDLLARATP